MIDQISKADPILGVSDRETVMLDLDEMSFKSAKDWAMLALEKFSLEGFIILKSSKKCYHVVFDRYVSWDENLSIVGWVAILSKSLKLKDYLSMQCIKMSSTLRVAPKGEKPSPRIVYRYGKCNKRIKIFLSTRKQIKKIIKNIPEQNVVK